MAGRPVISSYAIELYDSLYSVPHSKRVLCVLSGRPWNHRPLIAKDAMNGAQLLPPPPFSCTGHLPNLKTLEWSILILESLGRTSVRSKLANFRIVIVCSFASVARDRAYIRAELYLRQIRPADPSRYDCDWNVGYALR